jgi:acyl-[acyl-carrier-protein]-phospholipid O-acyltransferase/long-chain-fatty-acid--[acyl-carrier-protein] ligase
VALVRIEEELHKLAGVTELSFVAAGVPDAKKGERLAILHTLPAAQLAVILSRLSQSKLPNLWLPKARQFFRVEQMPRLGSGKIDLRRVRELAARLSAEADREPDTAPLRSGTLPSSDAA